MSSEISVALAPIMLLSLPIGLAAGIAATSIITIGIAATPIITLARVGISVNELAKISKQEKQLLKNLENKFIETNEKILSFSQKEEHIKRMLDLFSEETIVNKTRANEIIRSGKTLDDQIQIGRKLLSIQSTFAMLSNNMATLNNVCEQLDKENPLLNEYRRFFCGATNLSLTKLETQCFQLNQQVLEQLNSFQDVIEQKIRERKFDPQFFEITREEQNLFQTVFSSDLNAFINNPTSDETRELLCEKNLLESRIRSLSMLNILREMPNFQDYADRILRISGSIEKLSNQENLPFNDYSYEVSLKLQSLEAISHELEKQQAYSKRRKAMEIIAENNHYRNLLNLPPYHEAPSENETALSQLENENLELKERYNRVARAKQISLRMKMRYEKMNYQHIPSADTISTTPKTTIHKSYYVLPDQQNVLCVSVCENGNIFQRVTGVKIPGLAEDKKSIYEAQLKFCQDSSSVLDDMFPSSECTITREEPALEYANEEDMSMILPPAVINRVKQARQKRKTNTQQRRAIQ